MGQRYQQNVADSFLDAGGPCDFILALVEPLHDELVDVGGRQLLRRVMHYELLVDFVKVGVVLGFTTTGR